MAHIAERMASHYQQAVLGFTVTTCPDFNQIATYAREVRPNVLFGVPRVWEKVYAGVNAVLAGEPEKKAQFDDAIAAAIPIVEKKAWGTATKEELETWDFLDAVAFSAVRGLVGLDELDLAVTGAAPMPAEIFAWFRAIGVPLSEVYGMSESSGPMTFTTDKVKAGTVGQAIPGCEVRHRGGRRGHLPRRQRLQGLLQAARQDRRGDHRRLAALGRHRHGRRRRLLQDRRSQEGAHHHRRRQEHQPGQPRDRAEDRCPLIGQACAIGDGRPFISALLVLDSEIAPVWAKAQGIDFDSLADLARDPRVLAEVQKGVDEINEQFARVEKIRKFTLLGEEWLPDSRPAHAHPKLKRRGILARYAEQIEAMYT